MPSITGLEDKLTAVLECSQVTLNQNIAASNNSRISELNATRGLLSSLRGNSLRFANDTETREQAERRVITNGIDSIGHSNCSSCAALLSLL